MFHKLFKLLLDAISRVRKDATGLKEAIRFEEEGRRFF